MHQKFERIWFLVVFCPTHGYKLVFESGKFVLIKNDMFVGKGYVENGMFKLNLIKENAFFFFNIFFTLFHYDILD